MAAPYAASSPGYDNVRVGSGGIGGSTAQWQEPQRNPQGSSNFRSVTPAMNNTRGAVRNGGGGGGMDDMSPSSGGMRGASPGHAARMGGGSAVHAHYENRSTTPGRGGYGSGYEGTPTTPTQYRNNGGNQTPSSSGLIRLTLRKPMGIVFEPMYDPNAPSVQRGVRICDLPRTGAAALSRKLEIGDELLSINDKTMSRLTFDEIMDFIIEADADHVNLLFRRPRKETLNARHGIKTPSQAAGGTPGNGVKWVDDEHRSKKKSGSTSEKKKGDKRDNGRSSSGGGGSSGNGGHRGRKGGRDDDETFVSEDLDSGRQRKKGRGRKDPYESESFLDLLIDTICANPDNVCRDRRRREEEDYYSDEDDGTFASRDDSTYVTYESDKLAKRKRQMAKNKSKGGSGNNNDDNHDDEEESAYAETEEDTLDERERKRESRDRDQDRHRDRDRQRERDNVPSRNPSPLKENGGERMQIPEKGGPAGNYEDDGTLESVDSRDRGKGGIPDPEPVAPPLGLAHEHQPAAIHEPVVTPADTDDDVNPAPIKEVEYDDGVDHGADVSVMESLGGPSLLIEKQRQAAITAQAGPAPQVPRDIIEDFGQDYPINFGYSLEQTIQNDPLKFYTFVVKMLLEEHEPEKVRLLEKLMAKYKGREDHLVQKLSVRYNKSEDDEEDEGSGRDHDEQEQRHMDEQQQQMEDDNGEDGMDEAGLASPAYQDAINEARSSEGANANIEAAKQRMFNDDGFATQSWPDKETKEDDPGDHMVPTLEAEEESVSGSEYSGDSIDGTSPAVIAQVSELLNYVYGKTSVPGQIDRVSTIMRAYEGREAVLLELLETKALIKANREKENAANLPSFLRNSASAQRNLEAEIPNSSDVPPVTPMATQGQETISDDISSMSGVSSPAPGAAAAAGQSVLKQLPSSPSKPSRLESKSTTTDIEEPLSQPTAPLSKQQQQQSSSSSSSKQQQQQATPDRVEKKKKKGLFGGLFKKNKNKGKDRGKLRNEGSI